MPKKEQLEKIIRGKGLEALRPTAGNFSSERTTSEEAKAEGKEDDSVSKGEVAPDPSDETIEEQMTTQVKLNENCIIAQIVPSQEQESNIQQMLGEETHQILIWDAFISQDGNKSSAIQKDVPITFNVCCTASGLIAELKPEIEVHWVTYDILRMQIQPSYKFSVRAKSLWDNFKIQYKINPGAIGFFNFFVIVDLKSSGLFWVKEGFVFKILDAK